MPLGRAAQLSHVVSDVYSSICSRNRQFSCESNAKLGGGPAGFPPSPLITISRPVSRVLYGLRQTADVTTIPLVRRLPGASSNLPERLIRTDPGFLQRRSYSVLLRVGFAEPSPVAPAARCALTAPFHPYRDGFTTGAHATAAVCFLLHFPWVLSPPDVIRHRLSVEPGLSSPAAFRHWRGAAVRPTDVDRNGDMRVLRQGLSHDRLKRTVNDRSQAMALGGGGADRVSINARNVSSVEGSARPSTRACRKWRWNARTTFCVASS